MLLTQGRDFAGVTKLRILRWGENFGLLGGPNVIMEFFEEGSRRTSLEVQRLRIYLPMQGTQV